MSSKKQTTKSKESKKNEVKPVKRKAVRTNASLAKIEAEREMFEEKTPREPIENVGGEFHAVIEKRAYQLFMERGGKHGDDWNDWFLAEREIKQNMK